MKRVQNRESLPSTKMPIYTPNLKINVVPVVVLTPILAPKTVYKEALMELLKKKYGEENATHLDRAFERSPLLEHMLPEYRNYTVYISGSAVLSALKCSANMYLRDVDYPQDFIMFGLFFKEEDVTINIYHVTTRQNKPTLLVTEIVKPGSTGVLVYTGQIPEVLKVPTTQIGYKKRRGYGLIKILWR